ncbi:MAG: DNA internalization-related competence protein ComEC/Rec2 [Eubacteriales bacterium]|nr:DNA internalization-related competence protein ComEC/Rec2 [Eubacteriales bacterium]
MLTALMFALFLAGFSRAAFVSYKYGRPEAEAFFEKYEAKNPGGFDYGMYLKGLGIGSTEEYEAMKNGADADTAPLMAALETLRAYLAGILDGNLSEHDAGIYKAVVLGEKSEMDRGVRDLYQDAGIAHLLAVSGLHVSLMGTGLFGMLKRKFGRRTSAAISSGIMLLFMLMTGASGSAVRAVIMLIFSFMAMVNGRTYDMRSALSVSAIVMLLWRPYQIFSAGFQLSFGAVAAITLVSGNIIKGLELLMENAGSNAAKKDLRKRVRRRNKLPGWAAAFITSAGIQVTTLPIIAWHYFKVPAYGILLNFIVIPLMAVVLCSGLAVLGAGIVMGTAGNAAAGLILRLTGIGINTSVLMLAAAAPGHYVLKLYEKLAAFSLKLPFSSFITGRPGHLWILLYYLLLAAVIRLSLGGRIKRKAEVLKRCAFLVVGVICIAPLIKYRETKEFYVMALDVGQGDGTVIKNKDEYIMIDCGSSSLNTLGERVLEPFLLSRGIEELDMVIVSHSDTDHISGIMWLLQNDTPVRIKKLMLSAAAKDNEEYDELISAYFASSGKNVSYISTGDTPVKDGDFSLQCLYGGRAAEDINSNSSALLLKKGAFSMLFTGDAPSEDEEIFCRALPEGMVPGDGITVFKAAHHGSNTSNSNIILETFKPKYVIISCGRKNRYGHPHAEVLERLESCGAKVRQTQYEGAIEIGIK